MTATTINTRPPLELPRRLWRLALAPMMAAGLLAGSFAVGRASAPTHTVRSVVTVPGASAPAPADVCRLARPC